MLKAVLNFLLVTQPEKPQEKYEASDILAMQNENEHQVNLAYEYSLNYMQEIQDYDKIINARTNLLLGYLGAIVAGLFFFLFRETESGAIFLLIESANPIQQDIRNLAAIWLIIYLANIVIIAVTLINPILPFYNYDEPKSIMRHKHPMIDMQIIKMFEINRLQDCIEFNMERLCRRASALRFCIFISFMLPVLAVAFYFTPWAPFTA